MITSIFYRAAFMGIFFVSLGILMMRCSEFTDKGEFLYNQIDVKKAGIDFVNQLDQTEELNTYTFKNFYNGAGVGIGDINNDGLPDIYFCGNTRDNKLYLNKGEFHFEDITEKAGVACKDVWSTGVSMIDINADGWLDIYVCKSGQPGAVNRHNELFINNGDLTFTESSRAYGLDILGLSVHAAFLDYDRDGDLDAYLLNNSLTSVESFSPEAGLRYEPDLEGGNMLLRNDKGIFVDVTSESGIYHSKIGFGLGATVSDIDKDNWPDLYISNDFFERDYLYINNQDGTFREVLEEQIAETSMGAMGADIADLNNDGYSEIYVTEMTAQYPERQRTKTLFQSWESYQKNYQNGYYRQFARNTLQLNNRNSTFSEIGRYAGVHHTDWSWGALIFDMDRDGQKDIFVANGIFKDLLDRDYLQFYANPRNVRSTINESEEGIIGLIEKMPSERVSNYAFINGGDLTFSNQSKDLGLDQPGFSNGAAYCDLDNDGDLDIVINNINAPPFIYRNDAENRLKNNFISIILVGDKKNKQAIGSKLTLHIKDTTLYQELVPTRGFLSTVDTRLNFGLGKSTMIDSAVVVWPDGSVQVAFDLRANQFYTIEKTNPISRSIPDDRSVHESTFVQYADDDIPLVVHKENTFNDFNRFGLLFHMRSNEGPKVCVGDINKDGLEDFYICGAKESPGSLMVRNGKTYLPTNIDLFEKEAMSEETDCIFFDADSDGDPDLYVTTGSLEFPSSSSALIDKLYINDGTGNFSRSDQILPSFTFESTSCVRPSDFDGDGDLDLFVGVRMKPFDFGLAPSSYLLVNDGSGIFTNATANLAPGLKGIGHVTDASWDDVDQDGDEDLIIVGEWMPVTVFFNQEGKLSSTDDANGLEHSNGWWNTLESADIDNDGDIDFVVGNHGLNSKFRGDVHHPVRMYVNDFDLSGSIDHIITTYQEHKAYPLVMKDDLVQQMPSLHSRVPTFDRYKNLTLDSLFDDAIINKSIVYEAKTMETSVIVNMGHGNFKVLPLPAEVQFAPVYSLLVEDFDGDGLVDILAGGNQSRVKPEAGTYLASYGLLLIGLGNGQFRSSPARESGVCVKGEIRDFDLLDYADQKLIIVAKNNDVTEFLKWNR